MSFIHFFKASPAIALKTYTEKQFKTVRMKSFLAFTIGYIIFYVCRLSFTVAKPALVNNGVLTPTELGVIGAATFVTYAVGKFVNSAAADHTNVVRFLSAGLFLSALANFAMGLTGSAIGLTIIWAFNGWVQSMGVGPCVVALSRWYNDQERGSFYSTWAIAHNVGEAFSFIATATIVTTFGWQFGFGFAGIVGLLGVLLALVWMKDSPAACGFKPIIPSCDISKDGSDNLDNKTVLQHQWAVIKNPAIWVIGIATCCMYVSRYGVNSWGVFILENGKGYTTVEAASIISVNSIVGIAGTLAAGWLSDWLLKGRRNGMAIISGFINALALIAFFFAPAGHIWFSITALAVFGFTLGVQLCFLGGLLAVDISHKSASGVAMGMMGIFGYAGAAMGEFLTGFMIDKTTTFDVTGAKIYNFDALSYFWVGAEFCSVIATACFAIIVFAQRQKTSQL
ncbi:MFS transporter [Spirabiliibacterium falconis]|uniref:MFS transporter n=1 Tax=Spirabiliibacterium falconis TaxID=572023 RepID=UPI001AAD3050|nr:MFS transporter [Spirabiliibacterium falconis]MBE2894576.1 MFS transporter [Spirabiliibacterium falconis]